MTNDLKTPAWGRRALGKGSLLALTGALTPASFSTPARADIGQAGQAPDNMSPVVAQAWRAYLDVVEDARRYVFTSARTDQPAIRAEANEFFFQAQAAAYNWVMAPRVDYPRFSVNTFLEPMVGTWTGPCPDFRYRIAFVDGAQTYRIWGKLSNSRFLDIQLGPAAGSAEEAEFRKLPTTPYPIDRMHREQDGRFEIVASPDKHDGNWIKLDPGQGRMMFLVREAFYDWTNERPSLLRIERISAQAPRPVQWDEAVFVDHLTQAGRFLHYMVHMWSARFFDSLLVSSGQKTNRFVWADMPKNSGPNRAAVYGNMVYEIGPDDALIIESDVPTGKYWSFCLMDRFTRTTDFTYHQSSLNGHQARIDSDGRFRAVLAVQDPGVPNWLDPVGIVPVGVVQFRQYFQQASVALPTVRKVPLADVRRSLSADTPVVSQEDRAKTLRDRSLAMLALYGY